MEMPKYPTPIERRSGCKVGWYTYDNLADAEKASKVAAARAVEMAGFGYDFGWCSPGEITESADGTRFTVTVP
jgi:hypothetical protein